jgi:hypothetical protein
MSEEIDPQFRICLVKKSKYYFKKELVAVGTGLLILAGIGLCIMLMAWISSAFAIDSYRIWAIVALDLFVFGGIAIACAFDTEHALMNFVKAFFKLHIIAVTFIILLGLEMVCLVGAPIMAISLVWLIFSEVLGFGVIGGLISGIIIGIIVIPVNYSAFICFKIDPFINEQWTRILSWL